MFKCLEKMNYPKQYIQFLKIIYQETYSLIQNNGYFSECIKLERGVRQGCPLSFPLYCTQNGIFTNSVNKDPNINGFKLPGRKETLKLSQYADDTIFISTNFSDIPFIFEQFSKYKTTTGCSLNYLSDHRMITLNFFPKHEKKRGPSYWKLNLSIVQNKEYQNKITSFWQKWQQRKQNYQDPTVWWDNRKTFIQGINKDFCTKLKETETEHLYQLRMELQTLQIQKNKDQIKINTIEGEIEQIESYQHKSAMVRSRTKLIENEKKPTKLFYAVDKQNQNKKTITKLKNKNRELKTKDEEILKIAQEFYSDLYKKAEINKKEQENLIKNTIKNIKQLAPQSNKPKEK